MKKILYFVGRRGAAPQLPVFYAGKNKLDRQSTWLVQRSPFGNSKGWGGMESKIFYARKNPRKGPAQPRKKQERREEATTHEGVGYRVVRRSGRMRVGQQREKGGQRREKKGRG